MTLETNSRLDHLRARKDGADPRKHEVDEEVMRRALSTTIVAALVATAPVPPVHAGGLEDLQQFSDAFAELASHVKPSVVAIQTERQVRGGQSPHNEHFRGNPFFRMPQRDNGGVQEGLGSGVLVSREGYVLTNNHVIAGRSGGDVADRIVVELADLRSFNAEVVGRDPNTDLAVLKIDAADLPTLEFGDSDKLDVGEWVLAVGNPFGQLHTVTTGIVSAVGRGAGLADYESYIQTDAAINPGNSGGALIDTRGQLVGINTAIVSRSGGYQGIGFAIPINLVRIVMDQLIEHGEVRRGYLGVGIQDLTNDLAEGMGLETREGVLVTDVKEDTPAHAAGVQQGDVIVEVDGESTPNMAVLRNTIAHTPPGTEVRVTVLRDGMRKSFKVELATLDAEAIAAATGGENEAARFGIRVQNLTPELRERIDTDHDGPAVVVMEVTRGSVGARVGLRPGDLILQVNRQMCTDVVEFHELVEGASGTAVLLVERGGNSRFVPIRLPE